MFEHRRQPLISRNAYLARVVASAALAAGLVVVSLLIGVAGYHRFGGLDWIDPVLNASMILGGMGPVDRLETDSGKLFAAAYALYSGFALLTGVAVLLAPTAHRVMHRFHLEAQESAER